MWFGGAFQRTDHLHAVLIEFGAGLRLLDPDLLHSGQLTKFGIQRRKLVVQQGGNRAHAWPYLAGLRMAQFPVDLFQAARAYFVSIRQGIVHNPVITALDGFAIRQRSNLRLKLGHVDGW